jgi:hypothetical protein
MDDTMVTRSLSGLEGCKPVFGRTTLLKRANERVFVDESGDNGSMVCPLIFGNTGATAANAIVSLPVEFPSSQCERVYLSPTSEVPGQCVTRNRLGDDICVLRCPG